MCYPFQDQREMKTPPAEILRTKHEEDIKAKPTGKRRRAFGPATIKGRR